MRRKGLEPEPVTRRDFLSVVGLWTSAVAILGSIIGMARLPKPSVYPEAGGRFRLGFPAEFPAGSRQVIKDRNVLVISAPEGVAALSLVCTHLGCIVSESEKGFSCPCHGSKFDAAGNVVGGPAPRGLRWVEVSKAADGRLIADGDREVKPGTYFSA